MKRLVLTALTLFISIHSFAQLSSADRSFAIKYLNATHQNIVDLVKPLSDEAWNYTPEDGGWSVANCLEHILITEATFYEMVQGLVEQAELTPDFNNSGADGILIGMIANRGTQAQTAAQFEPSGKWSTKQEMLDELKASRKELTQYLNNIDINLRHLKAPLPFGEFDAYQVFLLIGGHSHRHTFQMQEVLGEMESM
jgi:hypothetical protein